jgi:hypothetical protein
MATQTNNKQKFISSGKAIPMQDTSAWPVVKAYAPIPELWKATAHGAVGAIRQQPDGRYTYASFHLSLSGGGIRGAFGKSDLTLEEAEKLHQSLQMKLPPHQEDEITETSAYLWGALTFGKEQNVTFPPGQLEPYLQMIPKPPGASDLWLKKLVGLGGKTPPPLVSLIKENFRRKSGKKPLPELPILTTCTFSYPDLAKVKEAFATSIGGLFIDSNPEKTVFLISREDPNTPPGAKVKGRQRLGRMYLKEPNEVNLQIASLQIGAMLFGFLMLRLGDDLKYQSSEWKHGTAVSK